MINKLQSIKSKTKTQFYQNLSDYYDQMNYMGQSKTFMFEEDPSSKGAEGMASVTHEALFLMELLQTEPQDGCKNINFYDLY